MDLRELNQINFEDEVNHWWIASRFLYLKKAVKEVSGEQISVLEYGFGSGQNLWFLSQQNKVNEIFGVDIFWKDSMKLPFESKKVVVSNQDQEKEVDFIVAMDVLEHIESDFNAVYDWSKKLKSGGSIFITVPAFLMLWSKHDEYLGHKRRYLKKELDLLMETVGFEKIYSHYIFAPFFPIVYLVRKILPAKKSDSSDLEPVHPILNSIFKVISKIEYWFGGCPLIGTSVVGHYRKR